MSLIPSSFILSLFRFEHGTPLDALLRMANEEEADEGDRDDPEFRDDPVERKVRDSVLL